MDRFTKDFSSSEPPSPLVVLPLPLLPLVLVGAADEGLLLVEVVEVVLLTDACNDTAPPLPPPCACIASPSLPTPTPADADDEVAVEEEAERE